jgi:thioredoxin 1
MNPAYEAELPRSEIDSLPGAAVIEFGTSWCGYCQAAQPVIATGLADRPGLQHLKVEDGKGRPLGRSFQVKLWPTLIFLRDGKEIARLVRPATAAQVREAASQIA